MSEKKSGLGRLAWYWQLVIFGVVGVLLFMTFWYFVTKPVRAETEELNNQIAQLRQKNEAARIASQRINEFRAAYAAKMEEYEELKALLPEQREITNVLQNLQERARTSKLVLRRFTPKDDVMQDFVSGKPVEVEVTSTFANLREFYDQLARLQRIVSVTDFNINQAGTQTTYKTIEARFVLTAYYASPENLSQKPGAPAAPPANAAKPVTPPVPGAQPADKY